MGMSVWAIFRAGFKRLVRNKTGIALVGSLLYLLWDSLNHFQTAQTVYGWIDKAMTAADHSPHWFTDFIYSPAFPVLCLLLILCVIGWVGLRVIAQDGVALIQADRTEANIRADRQRAARLMSRILDHHTAHRELREFDDRVEGLRARIDQLERHFMPFLNDEAVFLDHQHPHEWVRGDNFGIGESTFTQIKPPSFVGDVKLAEIATNVVNPIGAGHSRWQYDPLRSVGFKESVLALLKHRRDYILQLEGFARAERQRLPQRETEIERLMFEGI